MKNLASMTPAELRQTVKTFAIKAAVSGYQKANPGCAESSAWGWAMRHWVQYQDVGESCVIAIEVSRERAAFANN